MSAAEGGQATAKAVPRTGVLALLRRIDAQIQRVEVGLCLGALALMIVLAFTQVFLRQFRGVDLLLFEVPQPVGWFDNVARHLVIWVGLLGASLATAEGRHISIEAVPMLLSARGRRRVEVLVNLAALAVTALLVVVSLIYMQRLQMPNEAHLFEIEALELTVYRWPFLVVVPAGLLIICWRFILRVLDGLFLDDAAYAALRHEDLARDVDALEEVQEPQEVDLLLKTAQQQAEESGTDLQLDADAARAEVRAALRSDRVEQPAALAEDEDLLGEDPPARLQHPPPPPPEMAPQVLKKALKSTDEIPVYRDPADDEDLLEPELRMGPAQLDSSEELDVAIDSLVSETGSGADEALEAAADTARLKMYRDGTGETEHELEPTTIDLGASPSPDASEPPRGLTDEDEER